MGLTTDLQRTYNGGRAKDEENTKFFKRKDAESQRFFRTQEYFCFEHERHEKNEKFRSFCDFRVQKN